MPSPTPSCGAIYVATGEVYVTEAIRAARHLRKHSPNLGIHLFTDEGGVQAVTALADSPFSSFEQLENPNPRSKVDALILTPFDRTIFFDADTQVVADISEVFDLLERNDVAMAHAMRRTAGNLLPYHYPLPDAFPEFNSGVFAYRKTPDVIAFLENFRCEFAGDWVEIGKRNGQPGHDQTPLRELLWASDLRIVVLPPEYNIRYLRYFFFAGRQELKAKVFHLKQFHTGFGTWLNKTIRKTPGIKTLYNYKRALGKKLRKQPRKPAKK